MRKKGNPEPLDRRDELLLKYQKDVITPEEAKELAAILEEELEQAKTDKDLAGAMALGFLIAGLMALVSSSKK